ncbi:MULTISPECIES: hypothetical protein [Brevibacterium]|mgnify:CR=1 FL=1|uniref:Uncharacterized protein n=2 Tax=Brevibacterium casei TaxID=33889 RepID=K9ANY8_9MICO|nr:hypothetical protein [Brevibacterium casei]NJE66241.1 hypothetical protein [Brevibacterium sp. LS14]RAE46623.1 hypothetical protein DN540_38570 [Burkholderia multivorans]EKU49118.1 hypothetical protein C272_00240 [Brevibacterium casei S18]KZE18423.1 hypothetical protein AVW13_12705 [Brevibacterium casei]MBE4693289.1 hypothetical protein [Brevibacterium casei]
MSTDDEHTTEETVPDKSSKPAVAETTAPKVTVDRDEHSVGGSASSSDGKTEEHEVDSEKFGSEDAGPVDVDAVLTDDSSSQDDGPPEPPA